MLLCKLLFLLIVDSSSPHSELMGTDCRFRNSFRGAFRRGLPYQNHIKLLMKFNCYALPGRGGAVIK